MEKVLTDEVVQEVLEMRLPITDEFQNCSFILSNGKFLKLYEHYEAYKFLVIEELAGCIPDAEQLLNDLGWIRYSWIGYMTLSTKEPTKEQYDSIELALVKISSYRDKISIQIHNDPKFYLDFDLDDIPHIMKSIKRYYKSGKLKY